MNEESSSHEHERPTSSDGPSMDHEPSNTRHAVGLQAAIDHMLAHRIDALLWLTRLGTMIFTVLFFIPLFGAKPYSCYQRALLCNAATSALRLHQRLPRVEFTRAFGAILFLEDSCHYLLYSLLFIYSYPITMSLMPIFLYAFLHSAQYSLTILGKLGFERSGLSSFLTSLLNRHQQIIFRCVAMSEICLMPLIVFMVFSSRGSLLTPFAYYRFLTFRYSSRRNPYTRNSFRELRVVLENFATAPGRSITIRNMCFKVIDITSRLAPPIPSN